MNRHCAGWRSFTTILLLVACSACQACGQVAASSDAATAESSPAASGEVAYQAGFKSWKLAYTTPLQGSLQRRVDVWYPTESAEQTYDYQPQQGSVAVEAAVAPGRHPLILFSHGFLGAADQSICFVEEMARAGYIVAAINHADAAGRDAAQEIKVRPILTVDHWDDNVCLDRREDIEALLEHLLEENNADGSHWYEHIDDTRIGGCGHSMGGYTMLGLCGAWPSWKDDRIRAAVLWSPFIQTFRSQGAPEAVDVPIQMQAGTLDWGITPHLAPVYERLTCERCSLILRHATHLEWTNLIAINRTSREAAAAGNPELIIRYTIAFFDQHLRGIDRSDILAKQNPRLHSYRFDDAE